MRSEFPVLLIDDGELEDVRELLAEVGADFAHLRGGAVPERVHPPRDLFITSARRAGMAREWPPHAGGPGRPVKIAVVNEDSQTARNMLRRLGYDFLVRRPVHPTALRLLILRALYRGEEKRKEARAAVGYEVMLRVGLRRRRGLLADLSSRGCRVLLDRELERGTRLRVSLPGALAGGRELSLRGCVLRSTPEPEGSHEMSIAIAFEKLDAAARQRLLDAIRERMSGPAVLPEPRRNGGAAGVLRSSLRGLAPKRPRSAQRETERRRHRRGRFTRKVVALAGDARQVLLGRDLSVEGMRVEPSDQLTLGARLRIAIYGGARGEPLLVDAHVVRDDGEQGMALHFSHVEPGTAAELERLVAGLPSVEALGDGETGALGTVLSRIVSR